MRNFVTKCLKFSLNISLYNYLQLLTSTVICPSYDNLSTDITHPLTLIIDSQFRRLPEIFGYSRKYSATLGNVRLLSETVVSPTCLSKWPSMLQHICPHWRACSTLRRVGKLNVFNIFLSLQTLSVEENLSVCQMKAQYDKSTGSADGGK
jgi:hypothetical protein